ncbi:MAG: oligosaccharide flippase family protein [Duncaniella sp.]|nr:oligosaccharide flippase family protein [Duncaniella sp.]
MPSVKKNFFYSSILTSANYFFPLITFPYVSRILGVTNIGICNFIDSIINYFILFSMMGISTLGIREVATNKGNPEKLRIAFSSLITLNGITTLLGIILILIATFTIPRLHQHSELMFFGSFKLLFNLFLIEWFYKGLEDFRYVTIRTIIVKCIYVVSIFIFVRESTDYPTYYLLTVLMVVVNSVINLFHSRHFVTFSFRDISLKQYIKPYFTLGLYLLLTSMYVSFNVVYLGFACGDKAVGNYTTATKLYTIIIAFFTAFTGVMLPRMSALIGEGKIDEFKLKVSKSINILTDLSIPAIIFMVILAPQIVTIISGSGYEGAITPMRIIMPLMFIIGYEQILIVQSLMPLKQDKVIFTNSIIGATIGIVLNILLVAKLQATGSAIVWVTCEIALLILSQISVTKKIGLRFPLSPFLKSVSAFIPLAILIIIASHYIHNSYILLITTALMSSIYFVIIEFTVLKNSLITSLLSRFKRAFHNNC